MKVLAINGSPRRQMNTGQLLEKILAGAASRGAETELVHLRDVECFKGCISCFHCKDPGGKSYGRCIIKDALTPVLDKAHAADVLVLGTPVYFAVESGLFRSCVERLWFQYYLYTKKKPPLSPRKKATALVYTMNVPEAGMPMFSLDKLTERAKLFMENLFGSCEVFLSCDTLQAKDLSKFEYDYFNADDKIKRHKEVFPQELEQAFQLGAKLVS